MGDCGSADVGDVDASWSTAGLDPAVAAERGEDLLARCSGEMVASLGPVQAGTSLGTGRSSDRVDVDARIGEEVGAVVAVVRSPVNVLTDRPIERWRDLGVRRVSSGPLHTFDRLASVSERSDGMLG